MNQLSIQTWSGEEWENFIQRLLKRHHGHTNYQEVPAKHGGDLGLEGFSTNGCASQCYAAQGYRDTNSLYEAQRDKMGSTRKRDKWKCVKGRKRLSNRKTLRRGSRGNIIL